jgi:hypothetical protein
MISRTKMIRRSDEENGIEAVLREWVEFSRGGVLWADE